MLLNADGTQAGGTLVTLACAGTGSAFRDIEPVLRAAQTPLVFTPPVYVGDALHESQNPLFAVRALREFVAICLALNPHTGTRRRR